MELIIQNILLSKSIGIDFLWAIFFGFITALAGVFPPGLVNMTAARISLQYGKIRAFVFSGGALVVIFFQTLIALLFAKYISIHPEVVTLLREIGFGVFALLTLYFFFIAKKPQPKTNNEIKLKSKKNRFFFGMFISAINFFPVPYYVFSSISFSTSGYFKFNTPSIYAYVIGVVLGSFSVFYTYIVFFKKIENKTEYLVKNMNSIMGTITGIVAVLALYAIITT